MLKIAVWVQGHLDFHGPRVANFSCHYRVSHCSFHPSHLNHPFNARIVSPVPWELSWDLVNEAQPEGT